MSKPEQPDPIAEFKAQIGSQAFKPVLADPPWQSSRCSPPRPTAHGRGARSDRRAARVG
jgi:hypothetical protein